jgi:hypothetical protein
MNKKEKESAFKLRKNKGFKWKDPLQVFTIAAAGLKGRFESAKKS